MDIFAEIKGIKYTPINTSQLVEQNIDVFDINTCPPNCFVSGDKFKFSISKWVSPKRTRSYPFERVYNTLGFSKRVTVIPIIKDEGKKGDRDFIQWDTVSLMSLLDVYVILAYYIDADKHRTRFNKITNQKFDNDYVKTKLSEISNYHSSALHWNLKEIKETLPLLIEKVKYNYSAIGKKYNVEFHNNEGIERFKKQFIDGVDNFMNTSRLKAKQAQNRERLTLQPKEFLVTESKAIITIKNYLGGLYYWTTDEIKLEKSKLFLTEGKHSRNSKLPSIGDIKDGLLKMILYCNLENIEVNDEKYSHLPVLKLTSENISGTVSSTDNHEQIKTFFENNHFNKKQKDLVESVFKEGIRNNILIIIEAV
ncbi:MAG: hypothetical protein AYP45_12485 [Candidatus Brocadia carolinensis]|uniref:Uncharacterized protein n=1 Tax=Candidatus Brocadia carolinensis TaxID=1004156 RepID=A0A1V4ARY3_9BACT|nr:MAG: hypothetical protein AYP45_12485 [Candidatus Brocadia caroliniensis]